MSPLTIFASATTPCSLKVVAVLDDPGTWLEDQVPRAIIELLKNIFSADAKPGAVVAAQTRKDPNYYYHWVRDAGLVMDEVATLYKTETNVVLKMLYGQKLTEYLNFSDQAQQTPTMTGLGEPKFNVDGSAFDGAWGRPQTDSAAHRAISLINWANSLIDEGRIDFVKERLYRAEIPANTVIKRDLEYISHHWTEPTFDVWEEVLGRHFNSEMVQRKALYLGAKLALRLGDKDAANWYFKQAAELKESLKSYWDPVKGYIVATKDWKGGVDYKTSNADSSVILGLEHGGLEDDDLYPLTGFQVRATLEFLEKGFGELYAINKDPSRPGKAIGRYFEDRYSGDGFNGGNSWILTTLGFGTAYYRMETEASRLNNFSLARAARAKGDSFTARVRSHYNEGTWNEQIDRNTGKLVSVKYLTWNFKELITTAFARKPPTAPPMDYRYRLRRFADYLFKRSSKKQ